MVKPKTINPARQTQQHNLVSQQWSGPLPPPAALAQFNAIIPNGAERIMAMIKREQAHRILHEETILLSTRDDIKRGHFIGAAICIGAIGGAIYTAYIGVHPTVSIALVGVPVLGMIKAFIPSKK